MNMPNELDQRIDLALQHGLDNTGQNPPLASEEAAVQVMSDPATVAELPEAPAISPGEQKTDGVQHKVSAIYATRAAAEAVRERLIADGMSASAVTILHEQATAAIEEKSDEVLKAILVDGAIGTAVGTGVGAIGTGALWASSLTLFIASPVLAPLVMLGWFASIGGLVGAAAGTLKAESEDKEGKFSELVMDAIKSGHVVLIAHTHGQHERELAQKIIAESLITQEHIAPETNPATSSLPD